MTAAAWNAEQVFSDEDLRTEILSRLPVKSVVRCRCVCKAWRALISHPLFVEKYTGRRTKSKSSFRLLLPIFPLRSVDYEAQGVAFREHYYPVSLPKPKRSLELYGSSHGIVCLAIDYHTIILWNPSTGESNLLPEPPARTGHDGSIDFYGFGYDSTTQDYKIVRGYDFEVYPECNFEVFSLKTGSWRRHPLVDVPFDLYSFEDIFGSIGQGFVANDALHWMDSSLDVVAILVFSFAEEKLQRMLPNLPPRGDAAYKFEVGTVGDCLSVYAENPGIRSSSLWVMKEYGVQESWTELLNFDPSGCLGTPNYPPMSGFTLRFLCFLENGELLLANTEGDCDHFTLYDPKEKTFRDLIESNAGLSAPTRDAESLERPVLGPIIYEETFVSPVIGSM
ncbi:hypothetical protein M0R45_015289 [Rubus argutus]|uniref:F-box domain-containing protein n=1 Tax=Rubus argutus TaxID=59490 RepID=A0AAW1XR76_RUBAR